MQIKPLSKLLLSTALLTALSACSTDSILSNKVDYRSGSDNVNQNQLEIPPDLTQIGQGSTASSYLANSNKVATEKAQLVLPKIENAKIVNQDGIRFIQAELSPTQAWDQIRDFWLANGFVLNKEQPATGVMETDWLENRADLPADLLTRMLRTVADSFVSTNRLDKYRTRIEEGSKPNSVNIYVTYRGMTEVYKEGEAMTKQWGGTIYTDAPANPELEVEMMTLLIQALGTPVETAKTQAEQALIANKPKANLNGNELVMHDQADRAWRRAGLAFDRIGYNVLDRNRSTGVYSVQRAATDIGKESETSYFSSLAFWKKADADNSKNTSQVFDVQLKPAGDKTVLTITSKDPIDPAVQKKMLNDLLNQLK